MTKIQNNKNCSNVYVHTVHTNPTYTGNIIVNITSATEIMQVN